MTMLIINFLSFLLAIGCLVTLHEWGHFWVARRAKVKVLRFSIGFGKPIQRYLSSKGIEYTLGWLPLGGYVKMLDTRETTQPLTPQEKAQAFDQKPILTRAAIILAGPMVNLLFGIIAYTFVFSFGINRVIPIIGTVQSHSIAYKAGLKPREKIMAIDGQATNSWGDVAILLTLRLGEKGKILISTRSTQSAQPHHYTLNIDHWSINALKPQLFESLGFKPFYPPIPTILEGVVKNSPGERAGLKAGDHILAIDGKSVSHWAELTQLIRQHPNTTHTLKIKRQGILKTVRVTSLWKWGRGFQKIGYLGIKSPTIQWPNHMIQLERYPIIKSLTQSLKKTKHLIHFNFVIISKLIRGQLSLNVLGGPISIFRVSGQAWQQGVLVYIEFLALISIFLGLINLVPIPALDGGQLLLLTIEALRHRPLKPALEQLIIRLSMIFLIVLMFQATINDLLRMFL